MMDNTQKWALVAGLIALILIIPIVGLYAENEKLRGRLEQQEGYPEEAWFSEKLTDMYIQDKVDYLKYSTIMYELRMEKMTIGCALFLGFVGLGILIHGFSRNNDIVLIEEGENNDRVSKVRK